MVSCRQVFLLPTVFACFSVLWIKHYILLSSLSKFICVAASVCGRSDNPIDCCCWELSCHYKTVHNSWDSKYLLNKSPLVKKLISKGACRNVTFSVVHNSVILATHDYPTYSMLRNRSTRFGIKFGVKNVATHEKKKMFALTYLSCLIWQIFFSKSKSKSTKCKKSQKINLTSVWHARYNIRFVPDHSTVSIEIIFFLIQLYIHVLF